MGQSLLCMTMYFSNIQMQTDSFTLGFFFVQVYLKIIFSLQKLLNLGMKVLINNGNL